MTYKKLNKITRYILQSYDKKKSFPYDLENFCLKDPKTLFNKKIIDSCSPVFKVN